MNKLIITVILFFLFAFSDRTYGQKCDTGMEWNNQLQRCTNTKQSTQIRKEHKACQKLEDEKAKKECIDKSVNKSADEVIKDKDKVKHMGKHSAEGWEGWSVAALNGVMTGVVAAVNGLDGLFGGCLHRTLFAATSLAHLGSEAYFAFIAEEELKKNLAEFRKKDKSGNMHDTQLKAYEYIKKEQELLKEIAEQRSI
ncbi:MAG: hypothetical protein OXB84_05960, partial [Halobacteriovoraceae bacterium]|nr:hypothetical protein [Halobacteriovoraceae bacterium]